MKKKIKVYLTNSSILWQLDGKNIEDGIKFLQQFKENNPDDEVYFEENFDEDDSALLIVKYREETDEEYAMKTAEEKSYSEYRKEAVRQEAIKFGLIKE